VWDFSARRSLYDLAVNIFKITGEQRRIEEGSAAPVRFQLGAQSLPEWLIVYDV
jgi:hypothetical protein